ncbi:MAG TPA: hypothetical protein PL033_02025 [Candidatus Brocadiia bacterium]|nr:hypothetical protein [Candidatus Brocadiia bacterium]
MSKSRSLTRIHRPHHAQFPAPEQLESRVLLTRGEFIGFFTAVPWMIEAGQPIPLIAGYRTGGSDIVSPYLDYIEVLIGEGQEPVHLYQGDADMGDPADQHRSFDFGTTDDEFVQAGGESWAYVAAVIRPEDYAAAVSSGRLEITARIWKTDDPATPLVSEEDSWTVQLPAQLPQWDHWSAGDTHHHTAYTDNLGEHGAPLAILRLLAQSAGLRWVTATDHSMELHEIDPAVEFIDLAPNVDPDVYRDIWNISDTAHYFHWADMEDNPAYGADGSDFFFIKGEEGTSGVEDSAPFKGSLAPQYHWLTYGFAPDDPVIYGPGDPDNLRSLSDVLSDISDISDPSSPAFTYMAHPIWDNDYTGSHFDPLAAETALSIIDPYTGQPVFRGLEIWNEYSSPYPPNVALWEQILLTHINDNHNWYLAAGSDTHFSDSLASGFPRTVVWTPGEEPTRADVLDALWGGRFFVTDGPYFTMGVDRDSDGVLNQAGIDVNLGEDMVALNAEDAHIIFDWPDQALTPWGQIQIGQVKLIQYGQDGQKRTILPTETTYDAAAQATIDHDAGNAFGHGWQAFRAEVHIGEYEAYTNPIWINFDPLFGGSIPQVTVTSPPPGGASVTLGNPYEIAWTATDADGDPLTASVFIDADTDPFNGMTLMASGLSANSFSLNTWTLGMGEFYAYVLVSDGLIEIGDYGDGPLRVQNTAPNVTVLTPGVAGESISPGTVFNIAWTATDAESHPMTYSVYYDADKDPGNGRTLLAKDLTATSWSWNTTGVAGGGYNIQVEADDRSLIGSDYSDGMLMISGPPLISQFTTPDGRTTISLYDTLATGPDDSDLTIGAAGQPGWLGLDVAVIGGANGQAPTIYITPTGGSRGMGIVCSGPVAGILDGRPVGSPSTSFIILGSGAGQLILNSGLSGSDIDGLAFGGLVVPDDPDGDGESGDRLAIYSQGPVGTVILKGGAIRGDVVVKGDVNVFLGQSFGSGTDTAISGKAGTILFTELGGNNAVSVSGALTTLNVQNLGGPLEITAASARDILVSGNLNLDLATTSGGVSLLYATGTLSGTATVAGKLGLLYAKGASSLTLNAGSVGTYFAGGNVTGQINAGGIELLYSGGALNADVASSGTLGQIVAAKGIAGAISAASGAARTILNIHGDIVGSLSAPEGFGYIGAPAGNISAMINSSSPNASIAAVNVGKTFSGGIETAGSLGSFSAGAVTARTVKALARTTIIAERGIGRIAVTGDCGDADIGAGLDGVVNPKTPEIGMVYVGGNMLRTNVSAGVWWSESGAFSDGAAPNGWIRRESAKLGLVFVGKTLGSGSGAAWGIGCSGDIAYLGDSSGQILKSGVNETSRANYLIARKVSAPAPPHDTMETAYLLGTVACDTRLTRTGLDTLDGRDDFFRIEYVGGCMLATHFIEIRFSNSAGNLDLILLDSTGREIKSSKDNDDDEFLSIPFEGATYYAVVRPRSGATNPDYELEINFAV